MSTPHPDAAPTPGADQTVRLGPGTGEGAESSRTDAVPDPRADRTLRLPRSPLGGPDAVETVRLDREDGLRLTGETGTARLPGSPLGGPDAVETVRLDKEERLRLTGEGGTVRLSRPPLGGPDAVETVRLDKGGEGGTVPLPRSPLGAPDPRADRTLRLPRSPLGGPDPEATVRLDSAEPESATFLDPRVWGSAPGESATLPEPIPLPDVEAEAEAEVESATFLDPRVWGSAPGAGESATLPEPLPAPEASVSAAAVSEAPTPAATPDEHPLAPGELRRFGPGVPPQAAAAWHGETAAQRPKRPRRVRRWLVPVAVLLVVLALLFWRFHTTALAVTSVGVTTDPAGPGCGGTAVVTASVETNGGAGSIRYRWQRSDGTTSDELVQDVRSGTRHTDLVLRWTFDGQGSLQATATLQILSPTTRTATATFPYHCS